jgi:hypothetical protein
MKVHISSIYQPIEEEIPTGLSEFRDLLSDVVQAPEEADIHVLYLTNGTELTHDYAWIKDNAQHAIAVVPSNKYRRHAPKDFVWEECISLKHDKDLQTLVSRLNADKWNPSASTAQRGKDREDKKTEKEAKKVENEGKKKDRKDEKKAHKAAISILDATNTTCIPVPEGAKTLRLQLLVSWE